MILPEVTLYQARFMAQSERARSPKAVAHEVQFNRLTPNVLVTLAITFVVALVAFIFLAGGGLSQGLIAGGLAMASAFVNLFRLRPGSISDPR